MLLLAETPILLFIPMLLSEVTIRMNEHLRIAIDSLVELLIRVRCLLDADLVTDDKAGFGFSSDYQVTKVTVVPFDVGLTCC